MRRKEREGKEGIGSKVIGIELGGKKGREWLQKSLYGNEEKDSRRKG